MGRKVDVSELSPEEQKIILEVIQRDFDLRKKESERIGKLNEKVGRKTQETSNFPDPESTCTVCGSSFFWIFNQKVKCTVCDSYFCKDKDSCGKPSKLVGGWTCTLCYKQKEVEWKSLDWFYSRLRSKFRRHGGAKIVREFYKTKKGGESPPPKPPRLHHDNPARTEEIRFSVTELQLETINETAESDIGKGITETDSTDHVTISQSQMRKEIEDVIASTILPKFEELKAIQTRGGKDDVSSAKLVEEIIDQLSATPSTFIPFDDAEDDNALMRRYLRDHKQSVLKAVLMKIKQQQDAPLSGSPMNGKFPLRDAETMTDASDSESVQSGSVRSRSSLKTPLSERMRNLSPESLRNILNVNQFCDTLSVVQGPVLQKDQMIARAEVDSAISGMIDEAETEKPRQEFSTEFKFTAVGVKGPRFVRKESDSGSDTSENNDVGGENWIVPGNEFKQNGFLKTSKTFLPKTDLPSAYEQMPDSESDSDVIVEDAILPINVKKEFSEISGRSLSANHCEIKEPDPVKLSRRSVCDVVDDDVLKAMNSDLDTKENIKAGAQDSLPRIEEETIVPQSRDARVLYQSVVPLTSAVSAFQSLSKRSNDDSAYQSDVSLQSGTAGKREEEFDTFSSNSSLDGSQRMSQRKRPTILTPQRDPNRDISPKPAPRLKSSYKILGESKAFENALSEAIERHEVQTQEKDAEEVSPETQRKVRFSQAEDEVIENDDVTDSSTTEEDYDVMGEESKREILASKTDVRGSSDSETQEGSVISDSGSSLAPEMTNEIEKSPKSANQKPDLSAYEMDVNSDEEQLQVKSIDGIIADLKNAGLSGNKCRINRSSLSITPPSAPVINERPWKSQSNPSQRNEAPSSVAKRIEDWTSIGFKVDPATYKKHEPTVKQVSLTELLQADQNASQSGDDVPSRDFIVETPQRLSIMTSPNGDSLISGDDSVTSLPSVVQRRSLFASSFPSAKITKQTSQKTADDSDSDVSSMMSSSTDRPTGYDADTSTITSEFDDENRSITSSEARNSKCSLPDVVVIEKESIEVEETAPEKTSLVNKAIRELSPMERNVDVRGSITMRGGKMVMTSTPENNTYVTFQRRK